MTEIAVLRAPSNFAVVTGTAVFTLSNCVHGHVIKTEHDGESAIAAFIAEPFDLVLTDLRMPNLGGNELVRFVKAATKNVPVVALTGERETASELFDRVIDKPIYTKDLMGAIQELFPDSQKQTIN